MRRPLTPALLLAALLAPCLAAADEGMWTFDRFPADAVQKKYGVKTDARWLEALRLGSARIAQGCSASFVSADGLVMTNHHCVHTCVEQLSTGGKDLVKDGFVAAKVADEKKCPDLELNQLVGITDVTAKVKDATKGLDGEGWKRAFDATKAGLEKGCQTSPELRCELVTLFQGGAYAVYAYRRYADVRLVFAPEFGIAFFGGDPDNFEFPRYDLDSAFVRVYEGGKPARMKSFLRWSPAGAKAGEPVFVSGNPGTTHRGYTAAQLGYEREVAVPERLAELSELRGVLRGYQREGAEEKRTSTALLFYTENSLKVYRGLLAALTEPSVKKDVEDRERALRARIAAKPEVAAKADPAFAALEAVQVTKRSLRTAYGALEKRPAPGSHLFSFARDLVRGAAERAKPSADRLPEFADAKLPALEDELLGPVPVPAKLEALLVGWGLSRARELLGPDHPAVKRALGQASPEEVAAKLVEGTKLADPAVRKALWDGGPAAVAASTDPLVVWMRAFDVDARAARKAWDDAVEGPQKKASAAVADARLAVDGTNGYPDATFTARVSYGAVKGWTDPVKGEVAPFTTFAGAYARHTGRDPFALPPSWLAAKDKVRLDLPFDLVTDNDIIGGNSGSPLVNAKLEVVGLVFDGNLPSIAGDYFFDAALNRTVAVDSRAIVEALEKVYGAKPIADELRAGKRP
ncbi:MAG: S46 family peptidase [Anaeromyxobacteraceae bacterium]